MRISDLSSDVCSADLSPRLFDRGIRADEPRVASRSITTMVRSHSTSSSVSIYSTTSSWSSTSDTCEHYRIHAMIAQERSSLDDSYARGLEGRLASTVCRSKPSSLTTTAPATDQHTRA